MFLKRTAPCKSMSMREAEAELKRDASIRLIDVRTPEEYAAGHIPKSYNLPLDRVQDFLKIEPDTGARLFVYCRSGARSSMACQTLAMLGYENVTNIGGITDWESKIERGR